MISAACSSVCPARDAFPEIILSNLSVAVKPGNTLFTVIPCGPNSVASVFAQLATAPRITLETPKNSIGAFTLVEITLITRP